MSPHSATAFAPATAANLGPGFDILGLALDTPGDTVKVELIDRPGIHLCAISGDEGLLPVDPDQNTACVAAQEVIKALAPQHGLRLWLHKGLPLASGLGSSSASAVAGAMAANAVLGSPLSKAELLPACVEAEAIVSGRHADNVGPALMGGIVLVTGVTPDSIHQLPVPKGLYLAVVSPDVEVPTREARAVLPRTVPLEQLIHQTGAVARLVHALHTGDLPLLAAAMSDDHIIEPARTHLMPYYPEAKAVAKEAGALATVISGAGPTVLAICASKAAAEATTAALRRFYQSKSLDASALATTVGTSGASILEICE